MPLTRFTVDNGPHNMDGLRFFAQDGSERIEAFIGRKVMDVWAESVEHSGGRQSLFRDQYNALGKLNLASIKRIVSAKYAQGIAFNRQHPFVAFDQAGLNLGGLAAFIGKREAVGPGAVPRGNGGADEQGGDPQRYQATHGRHWATTR